MIKNIKLLVLVPFFLLTACHTSMAMQLSEDTAQALAYVCADIVDGFLVRLDAISEAREQKRKEKWEQEQQHKYETDTLIGKLLRERQRQNDIFLQPEEERCVEETLDSLVLRHPREIVMKYRYREKDVLDLEWLHGSLYWNKKHLFSPWIHEELGGEDRLLNRKGLCQYIYLDVDGGCKELAESDGRSFSVYINHYTTWPAFVAAAVQAAKVEAAPVTFTTSKFFKTGSNKSQAGRDVRSIADLAEVISSRQHLVMKAFENNGSVDPNEREEESKI